MVTVHDVARAARVSPMTVSNVLNGYPHVKPATRERVMAAVRDLDYRVNVAARNLRTGRTGTVGLAIPEVDRPYFGQLAAAIIVAASEHHLQVAIEQTGASRQQELESLTLSRNRQYDGLILSTVGLGASDVELLPADYPVVILGERIFGGPVSHIGMPNVDGARAAVAHLIDSGCRRIALVDGSSEDEVSMSGLRMLGYRQALQDAGLPFIPQLVMTLDSFTMEAGRDAIRELVRSGQQVDGVFCVTDTVAIGVLRGLRDEDIPVPTHVKVIGFDNIREGEFTVPRLSTVDPDHTLMARKAVELLVRRIEANDPTQVHEEITAPYKVIVRESTGSPR